ncbi:MAG: hypothetical protein ACPG7F_18330, partial [Aggregatilineales bacterium]
DDVGYPRNTNALLEAFTVPQSGRYLVGVSGFEDSAGAYELLIQPGYANLETAFAFANAELWQVETENLSEDTPPTDPAFESNSLQITLTEPDAGNLAWYDGILSDAFYAAVDVNIENTAGWRTGFVLESGTGERIILEFSHQGLWRTRAIINDTETILSDWVSHSAIIAGETAFTPGILITQDHLTIFYNSQAIGDIIDERLDEIIRVGIFTGNSNTDNTLIIRYENFYLSVPARETPLFPAQLPSGAPVDIVSMLQNQRLLAPGGVQILDLADVPAQSLQPGVTDFSLMRGQIMQDFVMGSRLSWQVNGEGTGGCGLLIRSQDDMNYALAYADSSGAFGLSERNDNVFSSGIFVGSLPDTESPYELIIVGMGSRLHYYVEKQYLGFIDISESEGSIGQAVVNFDAVNSSCRFQDTWLWSWE